MDIILETKGLSKTYGRTSALSGVNMNVPAGSIYGLVGKNGSGKTTLMRLVTGLASPSGGSFSLYGAAEGTELRKARKKIGAVIETPAVFPTMNVWDNLAMQCRIKGVNDTACIVQILEILGLADTGKKKVQNLSLGQKARLAFALVLVGEPDFLLLDEPANGLDPEGIIKMRDLLLRLNREEGKTILISSHILAELSLLATHYGFINNGELIKEVSASDIVPNVRDIKTDDNAGLEEYYMCLVGGQKND